jgi:hypothetical protein
MRWALAVLVAAAIVAGAATSRTAAAGPLPDCAPGTPAPPPPTAAVTGNPATPDRIVAGRFFTIEYDDPNLIVAVQDTAGPPGTEFDGGAEGSAISVALPSAGAIPLTARYFDVQHDGTCVFSFTFTVNVEAGQLLSPGIGVGDGPLDRSPGLDPLPRRGINTSGSPVLGRVWTCRGLHARVPITAILREERDLRRRPSESSPTLRIDMPDLCQTRSVTARAPGVALRFIAGSRLVDEGDRTIGVAHTATEGRRYWLQILQGTRLLASLRYYVAHRPQNGAKPALWVLAPEAAFERARCRRPPRDSPLGIHRYPLPPCPRR